MRARRLTLLLLLYVMADFSNPLMPGAVNFDESVEATAVHRENVERPATASLRTRSNADELRPPSELSQPERRRAAVPAVHGEWLVHLRRVHAQAHEFRPPSEDH
jgi:hypothetical protein